MSSSASSTNPLAQLRNTLIGAQQNTSQMITKMQIFEDRLNDMERKMRPLQTTTQNYTLAKDNISQTLVEV